MVEIGRAVGVADFAVLRTGFEAVNIPVFLHHSYHHSLSTHMALALGGVPIFVPPAFQDEALALLPEIAPASSFYGRWPIAVILVVLSLFWGTVLMLLNATFPRFHRASCEHFEEVCE